MFFGWEGVGLCSYALIGHFYHDEPEHWVGTTGDAALGVPQAYSPSHAGMKAFVMTRIGDIALLIAIFLMFATAGTFNYNQLATQLSKTGSWASTLSGLGLLVPTALLFFGGPIGKSAQFPLQEWLPDAMAGPTSVSALIHAATWVIHATGTRFMDQMGGLAKAMRLASIAMIFAGLSLMGIPPFSGFWTKDAILSATFESSQYILYAIGLGTVLLTAFYTTRMLGITFAGKASKHLEEPQKEGNHDSEAGLTMLIPYLALAVASLALGVLYPL